MTSVHQAAPTDKPVLPEIERFWCNITQQHFETATFETQHARGVGVVSRWARCPFCDERRRIVGQASYNAQRPQPHLVAYRADTGVQIAGGVLCAR